MRQRFEGAFDATGQLYHGNLADVVLAPLPIVPSEQGIHLLVTDGHDAKDTAKGVAMRYLLGLGVAKSVAEGAHLPDAWANIRLEKAQRLSVFGRSPFSEEGWRKPVLKSLLDDPHMKADPKGDIGQFTKFLQRYMPSWEQEAQRMKLFSEAGGVGHDVFADIGHAYKLWEGNRHDVVLIKEPHLDGYHFVVSPKASFDRQWQTKRPGQKEGEENLLQTSTEGWGIAHGIWSLFGKKGEIHNSGNWANGLKLAESDPEGKLSRDALLANRKLEKRRHRPDIVSDNDRIDTHTHTHVYIPRSTKIVDLPIMKKAEAAALLTQTDGKGPRAELYQRVIDHWDRLPKATAVDVDVAQKVLGNDKLTKRIQHTLQGTLIDS
jgi:hypothetical protein